MLRARLEERLQSLPSDWEIACLAGTDLLGHQRDIAAWQQHPESGFLEVRSVAAQDLEQVKAHSVAPGLKRVHPWLLVLPLLLASRHCRHGIGFLG